MFLWIYQTRFYFWFICHCIIKNTFAISSKICTYPNSTNITPTIRDKFERKSTRSMHLKYERISGYRRKGADRMPRIKFTYARFGKENEKLFSFQITKHFPQNDTQHTIAKRSSTPPWSAQVWIFIIMPNLKGVAFLYIEYLQHTAARIYSGYTLYWNLVNCFVNSTRTIPHLCILFAAVQCGNGLHLLD